MKELEEILRTHYMPKQFYVKEAMEMRGIELYSFESAMKALEQVYSLGQPKWIAVEDKGKLPEPGERVLAFHSELGVQIMWRDSGGAFTNSGSDFWKTGQVTHWQPLPPLPDNPKK